LLITAACGMVRPSDLAMRSALVSQIVPPHRIVSAMGVSRTTGDSARVIGALAGAGVFTILGIGWAYLLITALYLAGLILNIVFVPALPRPDTPSTRPGFLPEVWEGLRYVWRTPVLLAGVALAFLVNLTAYPTTLGLLPYVAREIYHIDQNGLGLLIASFSVGALTGSIAVGFLANHLRPARAMIVAAFGWYLLVLVFAYMPDATSGRITLVLAGLCQSFSMVPLTALLMRVSDERYRGRVMGVRMLAIYGLPVGLMVYSPIMDQIGFTVTATFYCLVGLLATAGIAWYWRHAIWPAEAAGNRQ